MSNRRRKSTESNKFVLHIMDAGGNMQDHKFDSRTQRDRAAENYLKTNPGKLVWKTQTRPTA